MTYFGLKSIAAACAVSACFTFSLNARADVLDEWSPFFGRTTMSPAITAIAIPNGYYGRIAYKDAAGDIITGVVFKAAANGSYPPDYGMPAMSGPFFYSPAIERGAAHPIFFNLASKTTVAAPFQLKNYSATYHQYFVALDFITYGYGTGVLAPGTGGGAVLTCPGGKTTSYFQMSAADAQAQILTPYSSAAATFIAPNFGQVIKGVSTITYKGTPVTIVNTGYVFSDPRGIYDSVNYLYEDSFYLLDNGALVPLQITGLVYPNNDRPPYYMAYSLAEPGGQMIYAINGPRFTFGYQQSGGNQGFDPGYPLGSWTAYIAANAPDFESSFSSSGALKMQRWSYQQIEAAETNHSLPLKLPTLKQLYLGHDPCG